MIETYQHKVTQSFNLWFDHTLLKQGRAFQNVSSKFYYRKDPRVNPALATYSSPFKQWVCDSSIEGAVIPSGVSGSAGFIGRNSGLMLDFDNGRIYVDSGVGTSASFSGSYSIKDFNTYSVTQQEQAWIFENRYMVNSRYGIIQPSGITPYSYALPACFITKFDTQNIPFAFGGEQDSKSKFRVIVASETDFNLDGCISIFKDMKEVMIPLLAGSDSPLNEYGDLKSGTYNYENYMQDPERAMFLEKVTASWLVRDSEKASNLNIKFGVIDFYLSEPRFPKQDF